MMNTKLIFTVSMLALFVAGGAHADLASTSYVDGRVLSTWDDDTQIADYMLPNVGAAKSIAQHYAEQAVQTLNRANTDETKQAVVTTDKDGKVKPVKIVTEENSTGPFVTGVAVNESGAVELSRGGANVVTFDANAEFEGDEYHPVYVTSPNEEEGYAGGEVLPVEGISVSLLPVAQAHDEGGSQGDAGVVHLMDQFDDTAYASVSDGATEWTQGATGDTYIFNETAVTPVGVVRAIETVLDVDGVVSTGDTAPNNVGASNLPVFVENKVVKSVTGTAIPIGGATAGAQGWATIWIE